MTGICLSRLRDAPPRKKDRSPPFGVLLGGHRSMCVVRVSKKRIASVSGKKRSEAAGARLSNARYPCVAPSSGGNPLGLTDVAKGFAVQPLHGQLIPGEKMAGVGLDPEHDRLVDSNLGFATQFGCDYVATL